MDIRPATWPITSAMQRKAAAEYGGLPQIMDDAGCLTFSEVEAQSARMARGLLAGGVGKGDRVGILLPASPAWLVSWFAITRIGAVAVLLSTFSKPRELAHVIRHADLHTLLMTDRYLGHDYLSRMESAFGDLSDSPGGRPLRLQAAPYLRKIWVFGEPRGWTCGNRSDLDAAGDESAICDQFLQAIEENVFPADSAVVLYTSGSTSDPKAVVHSHGALVRHSLVMSRYMAFQRGDRVLTTFPLFWVAGLCSTLLAANHKGAALVVPSSQRPPDIIAAIRAHGVTHMRVAAPTLTALLDVPGFREQEFARLKPASSIEQGVFGVIPPERAPNALGMTETFGPHSMELPGAILPANRLYSFGRQMPDVERKIIDTETGAQLGPDARGELCVRGPSLMIGYYKRERSDTFSADGWFHTGDICSISDDGYLFFHGRRTEMLKTSGANVAPREVEQVLMSHPLVREAAVIGLEDPKIGQMVAAAIVLRDGKVIDAEALQTWLRGELSEYKVPKRLIFLTYDEMPRTEAGKVYKAGLYALLERRLTDWPYPKT